MGEQRKTRVTWTQHEETMIAVEVQRMRNGESNTKGPTGRTATSFHSMINLAMKRVLEPVRHKSTGAVYTTKSYDESWLKIALARAPLYEKPEPAPAAPAAADDADPARERVIEQPPEEIDPELEGMLVMGSLVQTFMGYLGGAITRGVKQALVELRDEEERRQREDGHFAAPPPKMPTSAREIVRRKIDVIGLLPMQKQIVAKNPVAKTWDIRFLHSGQEHGQASLRERVIICSKFVSHSQQNRYRQMKAEIHWANGGALSVIKELEKLSRVAPNGANTMH
jgi:hypothetical protein